MTPLKDKKSKAQELVGSDVYSELQALSPEALNKRIADSNAAIADTKTELDAMPEYQRIKEDKKALEAGYNEVKKYQNAIIKLCLELRNNDV